MHSAALTTTSAYRNLLASRAYFFLTDFSKISLYIELGGFDRGGSYGLVKLVNRLNSAL